MLQRETETQRDPSFPPSRRPRCTPDWSGGPRTGGSVALAPTAACCKPSTGAGRGGLQFSLGAIQCRRHPGGPPTAPILHLRAPLLLGRPRGAAFARPDTHRQRTHSPLVLAPHPRPGLLLHCLSGEPLVGCPALALNPVPGPVGPLILCLPAPQHPRAPEPRLGEARWC